MGNWSLSGSLSTQEFHAGEPFTLSIRIKGSEPADNYSKKELNFPGFRSYPPEFKTTPNGGICQYTLIPLQAGTLPLNLKADWFNPVSGKYETMVFEQVLSIQNARNATETSSGAFVLDSASTAPSKSSTGSSQDASSAPVFSVRSDLGSKVLLPLYRNTLFPAIFLAALGLIIFIASCIVARKRRMLSANPAMQRKLAAKSRKAQLLKDIQSADSKAFTDEINLKITGYLNDLLGLPKGSGLEETAEAVKEKDPELAGLLKKISECAWIPNAEKILDADFKSKLIQALSKFSIFLICSAVLLLQAPLSAQDQETTDNIQQSPNSVVSVAPQTTDSRQELQQDLQKNLQQYLLELNENSVSPNVLYNIGVCYQLLGDLPRALAAYERALLLAPRDSDIQEHLNMVRKQLMLPVKYSKDTPYALLIAGQDAIRLDEWILLAGIACFLFFLGLSAGCFLGGNAWKIYSGIMFVFFLLCCISIATQSRTLYAENAAIVLNERVPLRALPSISAADAGRYLKEGEEVLVLEKRLNWARVKAGSEEGWIPAEDIALLWTGNLKSGLEQKKPSDFSAKPEIQAFTAENEAEKN